MFIKAARQGERPLGKIDASLNEKLQSVKWGEYELNVLFEKIKTNSLDYKTADLPSVAEGEFNLPALTAGIQNQGLNNYVPRKNATILQNVISISANGANTGATFYQSKEFTVLQDAYAIKWIYSNDILTDRQYSGKIKYREEVFEKLKQIILRLSQFSLREDDDEQKKRALHLSELPDWI